MITEDQKDKIRSEYLIKTINQLGKELNCSGQAVSRFMKKNNLKLPDHIVAERRSKHRFKKGHKAFNKGLKLKDYLSDEKYEKVKKTMFKKGRESANARKTNEVFYRTKLGVRSKYIKTEDGEIKPYNRHLWKQHHGEIPPNHNIVFKDGNSANCDISNLECISHEEKMLRNGKYKQPKELIPTMALLSKLNKQINNKMAKNKLADLNNHLFAQLERLSDEELKGEDLKIEQERAKSISLISKNIIDNAKLTLEVVKTCRNDLSSNTEVPEILKLSNEKAIT